MKGVQQVCRGQVWWVFEDKEISERKLSNKDNHIQAKSRPWLVVSCDENNSVAPIVTCVAISTGQKDKYPMHVYYEDAYGRPLVIKCEQIKTLNLRELAEYRYTLTRDLMEKVDIALAGQLGLNINIPSYESIISLVEKIAQYKADEIKKSYQKVTDDAIIELASRIEKVFEVDFESRDLSKQLANKVELKKPDISLRKAQDLVLADKQDEVKEEPVRRKYESRKWEPQKIDNFLNDCDNMSPTEVAKKYGLKDKKAVYSYKYYFRGKRNENDRPTKGTS